MLSKQCVQAAAATVKFFGPATTWIARWMPVFFVPSLVMLPLTLQGLSGGQLMTVLVIVVAGLITSCVATAQTTVVIRSAIKTDMEPFVPTPSIPPFHNLHITFWAAILAIGFALINFAPTLIFNSLAATASIFFLAATMLGFIIGTRAPAGVKKIVHPITACAIAGEGAVLVVSALCGQSFLETLRLYTSSSGISAGATLLFFLATVIVSFAFQMYSRRKLMMVR